MDVASEMVVRSMDWVSKWCPRITGVETLK